MPKTIQIRDLDDEVYRNLRERAAEEALSVPELLRREITRLTSRPSMRRWLTTVERTLAPAGEGDVVVRLDEERGEWPKASARRARR